MDDIFDQLSRALTVGPTPAVNDLLQKLRQRSTSREAFDAALDCASIELGESRLPQAISRFLTRIESALDPDCHL